VSSVAATHNRRFAVPERKTTPAWRRVRREFSTSSTSASVGYEATVLNDNTVRLGGHVAARVCASWQAYT